ncbi:MAG TPA: PAS domain-containing protein [Chryseolinea sp.]|nr:PAS domain-containing protein [Chryseolinea sp.]
MVTIARETRYHFLEGGGEMGALTLAYDWSLTPLGPVEAWPQTLKAIVGVILHSEFPMFLWWGDEMIQFYNDAYRPSLGETGKHPVALGQRAIECWPEIWPVIYPLINQVRTTNKSFFLEDQLIPIYRNGHLEEVYWTFSYSSVIGETGAIDGVLVVCHETTSKVQTLHELERTKKILLARESNLLSIISQAPVAMCILTGPQHIVEIANEKMFELWGKPREAFLGKPVFDVLIDARYEGFEDLLKNVYHTGKTYTAYGAPVTLFRNEGTATAYVHFVYEVFREPDGTISGVMVVASDVTEEVLGRKSLEASEHQIRAIIESAPFPIGIYVGREMRIQMANQSIIDVWGKGPGVVGKTYREVLPELEGQEIYPQLDHVYTSGQPFHARNQQVDLVVDGKLRPFYFNYSFTPLYDRSGKVYGVMNTAADVSDLIMAKMQIEKNERNFRSMVKQAPVAMCIMIGPNHVVHVANDLIIELWGKPQETVMNKPIVEALPEVRDQGLIPIIDQVYITGCSYRAIGHPVRLMRNGKEEIIYQDFVYEPYKDADGTILGVLAITIDVTEQVLARQKIEEVVAERTRDLQKSNAELSQFAYIASHDLQEPARKISTFLGIVNKSLADQVDPRTKMYLEKIETSAARMLTLIRDVLSISQLSKINNQFENIDLNGVLEEVCSEFELLIEQKQATIESDPLPVVYATPVQMSQLFGNLISNALKFAKPDVPSRIRITVRKLSRGEIGHDPDLKEANAYYKISVSDNGIGFNQANALQIFDIFQRLHAISEYEGTGIGLSMCRKIVENHGGRIYASGELGVGATFTVLIPGI